jgi:hypothetical protein
LPEPIVLDRGDYFELMAAQRAVEVAKLEAAQTIALAEQRAVAIFDRVAPTYALRKDVVYRFADATCSLIPVEPASQGG